nr:pentatricopeptide repeat-containing protein [Tanacetum cinerariifolium]
MFIELVIQNQFFSYSLEEFAQIFDIPCEGACVFTDKWSLDELAYGVPTNGPYQTNPPSPDDIISSIRIDQEGQVTRIRHEEEINVHDHQILTRDIVLTLKPLEEIIRENVFCLRGNRDHVFACLCYMFYCVVHSKKFNLAYYMAKRMESDWCQANGSKVEEKLVHLKMVVKFKVLIEKKKMCSLGLMRFDWWMEFLMVHLEELEIKKLLLEKV